MDNDYIEINDGQGKKQVINPENLAKLQHTALLLMREYNPDNKAAQAMIAPYEHQAFAREATAENPLMGLPIALATPLYAGAKSLGLMTDNTTTPPSWNQVGRGLLGVGQGLKDWWQR